jgi:predicted ATPase
MKNLNIVDIWRLTHPTYRDYCDKPPKSLSRQLRHLQASRAIHKINDRNGQIVTDAQDINKCFAQIYPELQWGKKVFSQKKVFSLPLKKMRGL